MRKDKKMRRRSTEIIQYLIKNSDQNMTLKELALKYEISQKVLKSDMKDRNQSVSSHDPRTGN